MLNSVQTAHHYDLIVANEYLCVAACLEMILKAESIIMPQSEIGEYFGINVSSDYSGPIRNVKYTDDLNRLGIVLKEESINEFFSQFQIPLKEDYVSIKTLQDWMFEDLLAEKLALGSHVVCGFSYGTLYKDEAKKRIGHVGLVEAIGRNSVVMLDPGPLNAGEKQVEIGDLFSAIHQKNDGVWVISRVG